MITIQPTLIRSLTQLGTQYELDFVVLFGSQVTGRTHPESDIDLGYTSREPLPLTKRQQLEDELQQLFAPTPMELIDLRIASPLLQKKALLDGKILVELTPHSFVLAQMQAYRLYLETQPLRALARKQLTRS